MNKEVGIVIVNFNNWQDTLVCLNSIIEQDFSRYHISIVNNGSLNDSFNQINIWIETYTGYKDVSPQMTDFSVIVKEIKSYKNPDNENLIFLIETYENKGFAGGNNIGISTIKEKIDCSYFWLLNNDTYIELDTLGHLVKRMEEEKQQIGILGAKIMDYVNKDRIQSVGYRYNRFFAVSKPIGKNEKDKGQYNVRSVRSDFVMGASLFVDNNFIDDVGLMSLDYFLYFEELDWIIRGKKKGWNFGYEFKSKVYHKQGGTTGISSTSRNELLDFYQIKNRLLFTYKFYPAYLITLYPALLVSLIKRIVNREFKAAVNILKLLIRFK